MPHNMSMTCPLANGIHARPASQIANFCNRFSADISWRNLRNGQIADGKSVLSLISADILFNDPVSMVLDGPDAIQAAEALQAFVQDVLPYCDAPLTVSTACRSLPRSLAQLAPQPRFGQPVGQGVAIGTLAQYRHQELPSPADLPASLGREQEQAVLEQTLADLTDRLARQSAKPQAKDTVGVIRAHLAILRDPDFHHQLQGALQAGDSAAQAVLRVVAHYRELLSRSASDYLRERELDIRDVGQQLLAGLLPAQQPAVPTLLPPQTILWAEDLTPSAFLALDLAHLKGLLLARGGTTSHTVILARAFSLPVLTGINASVTSQSVGQQCVLDANLGALFLAPSTAVLDFYHEELELQALRLEMQQQYCQPAASHRQGQQLELAVNIATSAEAQLGFANGAEGVGLFRTEMLYLDQETAPDEEEQYQCYAEVVRVANGRPVIIRTFDIGGDKPAACFPAANEHNPFLGYRAIRMYPDQEAAFRIQLRAILRASLIGPVKVMIPMIATLGEIRWVRQLFDQECQHLQIPEKIPLGIMLEVPSILFQMAAFCQEVDFFSVGSNDLTQYLFAADRENSKVRHLYDSLHPAFLQALHMAVETAHRHGRWIGLCGEFAASPLALPLLLGLGFDELSMGAPSLIESRKQLQQLDQAACRQLLQQALAADNSQAVVQLVQQATIKPARPMYAAECMVLNAPWSSKAAVIKGLVDRLWLGDRCDDRYGMEEDLWLREEAYSTGLGFGFAIPHAKSEHVQHPTLCIARLQQPVEWGASDGAPVDMVLMLAFNAKQAGSAHLKFFSRLARLIMHASFRKSLRQLRSPQAIIDFLQQEIDMEVEVTA